MSLTLLPDLLLDARGATSGLGVTIEGGRVIEGGPALEGQRLRGQALAPGFKNAHSHAEPTCSSSTPPTGATSPITSAGTASRRG